MIAHFAAAVTPAQANTVQKYVTNAERFGDDKIYFKNSGLACDRLFRRYQAGPDRTKEEGEMMFDTLLSRHQCTGCKTFLVDVWSWDGKKHGTNGCKGKWRKLTLAGYAEAKENQVVELQDKLNRLYTYIRGEVPIREIEDILEEVKQQCEN